MKKIFITGNVGKDPEIRSDGKGGEFVTFSLAVSVGTKQNPKTDWVGITCNGKTADTVKNYVKKGNKLLIEGFPSIHAYIAKDGTATGEMRVAMYTFEFIGSIPQDNHEEVATRQQELPINNIQGDEIPF